MLRQRQVGANPETARRASAPLAALHLRTNRISSARELLLNAMPALDRRAVRCWPRRWKRWPVPRISQAAKVCTRQYRERALVAAALHAAGWARFIVSRPIIPVHTLAFATDK